MARTKRNYKRRTNVSTLVKNAVHAYAKKTVEVKHKNVNFGTDIDDDGYALQVHDFVNSGTGTDQRIGARINMLSLALNSRMSTRSTNGGSLRVLVVETRRPLAFIVLNQSYDIRPIFDASAGSVGRVAASLDYDWVRRVYHDRRYTFNQLVTAGTITKYIKFYVKFGKTGKRLIYDQTTIAPAITETKSYVYCCFVVDDVMNDEVTPRMLLKIRYTDE